MKKEDIELFCKNRKVTYISHREGENGQIHITIQTEKVATEESMKPYIDFEKMKPVPGERTGIDDVIDWYNKNIKTAELTDFELATEEQRDQICELYYMSTMFMI